MSTTWAFVFCGAYPKTQVKAIGDGLWKTASEAPTTFRRCG